MKFKELESKQKLRGGYYTPAAIAEPMSKWVLADGAERVLEPSCGDGVFLRAIHAVVENSGIQPPIWVDAIELFSEEAEKAAASAETLETNGTIVQIINQDFFEWFSTTDRCQRWQAIVGNPPYIRYQYFEKDQRDRAESIFHQSNVPFSKRTNAWVPFVIASVMSLAPGGRMALVVPSELLHIQHASGLRKLLEQEMESVVLVNIREMVFDDTLQGILILLAIKRRNRLFEPLQQLNSQMSFNHEILSREMAHLRIVDVENISDLHQLDLNELAHISDRVPFQTNGHWMYALLSPEEQALINYLRLDRRVLPFASVAEVDIGIVTGANNFFVVDEETLERYDLRAISAPMLAKSDLIQGITYTSQDHERNVSSGRSVYFLEFPESPLEELPPLMADYIKRGQEQELHTRYKCRIRTPWYVVPYVWVSELALLKRAHRYPRLVINKLGAYSTDTAYRIRMLPPYIDRAQDLAFSFLNSLTFLTAELEGRHYGGGVLELVPSEVEELLIPLVSTDEATLTQVDQMIRDEVSLEKLVGFTDPIILGEGLGLSPSNIKAIQQAHHRLLKRRLRA
jgi:adenine-specific DNA-methyltransferase